ncbi:sensor histidine kinase [Pseudorhodoferax sp.]|uniref:sensor histidine kinase n=1 Tax=Pseudorhodoferax sp. TaxID=1993553 RepID=UPI002DD667B4|nr:hybrid sensor histidine kinase/response regulator [Pseudorhodoferax sp.]
MPDLPRNEQIDDLLELDDEPQAGMLAAPPGPTWKVLVVDDDQTVHQATELAMQGVEIEGRPLAFVHAHSAADALVLARQHPDLAVALVDVVMEQDDAGLGLVRALRQTLGLHSLRVVLRTGQPGYAPEIETARDFDIDGYWTKTDMTRTRLHVGLTTAIRTFRQFSEIETQRDRLLQLAQELERARAAEREAADHRLGAERALRQVHETMESAIEQRTQELSSAVAELDAFNRRVAHDLRGPLHGMSGLSSLILGKLDTGDVMQVRAWVAMLETQSRRLGELVGGLLDLSRAARGGPALRAVALADLVEEARQTLALSDEPNKTARLDVGPLPELPCDPVLMRQVFFNLIGNAMKFTRGRPAPLIQIRAERQNEGAAAPVWRIDVRDNGVGFPSARSGELFRPFQRLHGGRYEGSGIGLTVVQRIVQQHGGQVWARSDEGQGACFSFTLPA